MGQFQSTTAKFSAFIDKQFGLASDYDNQIASESRHIPSSLTTTQFDANNLKITGNLTFLYERGRLPKLNVDDLGEARLLLAKRGDEVYASVIIYRGEVVLEGEEKTAPVYAKRGLVDTIAQMVRKELEMESGKGAQ
jgi:hypothetical protein